MKKTYIHPNMTVVALAARKMLCESSLQVSDTQVNGSEALGRGYDDFDDE